MLLVLLCIVFPHIVHGVCSCSQASPGSQYCSGDSQVFLGETELFVGSWQTCDTTSFQSNFTISAYNMTDQVISLGLLGVLEVMGDLVTLGNDLTISAPPANGTVQNATLEIYGNLRVNGIVTLIADNIIIHENVFVMNSGSLLFQSTNVLIYGSITTWANVAFLGANQNSTVKIAGSILAVGAQNITFTYCTVSVGAINAPTTTLTIGAITATTVYAKSISAESVTLKMLPIDQGQFNFQRSFQIFSLSSPITIPVNFEKDWVCGNYNVSYTTSTTQGLSIILNGNPLTAADAQYCCFELIDVCSCVGNGKPLPSQCTPTPTPALCEVYLCNQTAFVLGWIIGAVLAVFLLGLTCTVCIRDIVS